MKFLIFAVALFFNQSLRAEYPYVIPNKSYNIENSKAYEVTSMPPIKAQDYLGMCYGFSATAILENYRCRKLNIDCSEPHELISTLDVSSYSYSTRNLILIGTPNTTNNLGEGGSSMAIFINIQKSNRKIAREECAKFASLINNSEERSTENIGWDFLINKWKEYKGLGPDKKRNDCVSCIVESIKDTLVNVTTPAEQIKSALLSSKDQNEFLYKMLLPVECLQEPQIVNVPTFETKVYPAPDEKVSKVVLAQKIESLILSNIPMQLSICTRDEDPCPPGAGHALVLSGIKEVCSSSEGKCKKVVKVQNSYGMSWQNQNNDGWLDLDTLVDASVRKDADDNISWIQEPGYILKNKKIPTFTTEASVQSADKGNENDTSKSAPVEKVNSKVIMWKCPGGTYSDRFIEEGCIPFK
jgi:hypothetical protein